MHKAPHPLHNHLFLRQQRVDRFLRQSNARAVSQWWEGAARYLGAHYARCSERGASDAALRAPRQPEQQADPQSPSQRSGRVAPHAPVSYPPASVAHPRTTPPFLPRKTYNHLRSNPSPFTIHLGSSADLYDPGNDATIHPGADSEHPQEHAPRPYPAEEQQAVEPRPSRRAPSGVAPHLRRQQGARQASTPNETPTKQQAPLCPQARTHRSRGVCLRHTLPPPWPLSPSSSSGGNSSLSALPEALSTLLTAAPRTPLPPATPPPARTPPHTATNPPSPSTARSTSVHVY